jgi:four helix bundle protein
MDHRKNVNRGYQKLIVWQAATDLYLLTCKIFGKFQYDLRVGADQNRFFDSVHRNIAEGYCRRSRNEYLNIALASLGDSFQLLTCTFAPIR